MVLSAALLASRPAHAQSANFIAARTLYASASYEEALSRFSAIQGGDDPALIEQYKALCLFALGRVPEAQEALEHLVVANPRYTMREADVSPRVVALFNEVRKRVLPDEIRNRYARAKAAYDDKKPDAAVAQFKDLVALLGDRSVMEEAPNFSDMKMLAEGFLQLSTAELAAKTATPPPVAPPPATAANAGTPPSKPEAPAGPRIYEITDKDVTPPKDIVRQAPAWKPPTAALARVYLRGVLEVVIDEDGHVEKAAMVKAVSPFYDPGLLEATKGWRFTPAMRNGVAVKYRKLIEIVLEPEKTGDYLVR
jgi:tetratricopeptide (TPR) repeat protein